MTKLLMEDTAWYIRNATDKGYTTVPTSLVRQLVDDRVEAAEVIEEFLQGTTPVDEGEYALFHYDQVETLKKFLEGIRY